jgi:hypothetical protein
MAVGQMGLLRTLRLVRRRPSADAGFGLNARVFALSTHPSLQASSQNDAVPRHTMRSASSPRLETLFSLTAERGGVELETGRVCGSAATFAGAVTRAAVVEADRV